jgi:hypothetical protein
MFDRTAGMSSRTAVAGVGEVSEERIVLARTSAREAQTVQSARDVSSELEDAAREDWETENAVGADSRKVDKSRGCSWRYSC